MSSPVKVALVIPNNGSTAVEAYENRLLNFFNHGILEEQSRWVRRLWELFQAEVLSVNQMNLILAKMQDEKPFKMHVKDTEFIFYFLVVGRLFTPLARERACEYALQENCDYLFMVDDDMMSPHDLFEKLYRHKKDIVGPLMFTRNPPHRAVIYSCVEGYDHVARTNYFINNYVLNYPKDKLFQCDAIGFGSVLIDMKVVRAMKKPYFAFTSSTGEDIGFCYRAKKLGFKTWVDAKVDLGHLGAPVNVTKEYAYSYWDKNAQAVSEKFGTYNKYEEKKELVNAL